MVSIISSGCAILLVLFDLANFCFWGGNTLEVPFDVLRGHYYDVLSRDHSSFRFHSGNGPFCALFGLLCGLVGLLALIVT